MPVSSSLVAKNKVFLFPSGERRVVQILDNYRYVQEVIWEYADGVQRGGRLSGKMRLEYFARDAISPVQEELSLKAG
ncbi:hypothetical protein ACYPKM_01105 [Pseudomonas aeruginosa]